MIEGIPARDQRRADVEFLRQSAADPDYRVRLEQDQQHADRITALIVSMLVRADSRDRRGATARQAA